MIRTGLVLAEDALHGGFEHGLDGPADLGREPEPSGDHPVVVVRESEPPLAVVPFAREEGSSTAARAATTRVAATAPAPAPRSPTGRAPRPGSPSRPPRSSALARRTIAPPALPRRSPATARASPRCRWRPAQRPVRHPTTGRPARRRRARWFRRRVSPSSRSARRRRCESMRVRRRHARPLAVRARTCRRRPEISFDVLRAPTSESNICSESNEGVRPTRARVRRCASSVRLMTASPASIISTIRARCRRGGRR